MGSLGFLEAPRAFCFTGGDGDNDNTLGGFLGLREPAIAGHQGGFLAGMGEGQSSFQYVLPQRGIQSGPGRRFGRQGDPFRCECENLQRPPW
jgi:hypothetical protein